MNANLISVLRRASLIAGVPALLALIVTPASAQQFLDITSLTPGVNGSFSGTLGAVSITGAITVPDSSFEFATTGTDFFNSTTDNTSPQYSYADIYTPSEALTDRVGYLKFAGDNATMTFTFSSAVTNPVFHVANLDGASYNFAPTVGLLGLSLLSGNGGGGDGLAVSGSVINDANPATLSGGGVVTPPPTTGPRSSYGSVLVLGTFTTLTVQVSGANDGGSFTMSTEPASVAAPEPGSLAMLLPLLGMVGMVVHRRKKLK